MNIQQLRKQLAALGQAEEAKKNTIHRAPFSEWVEGLPYWQNMSQAQKSAVLAQVDLWYEPESVKARTAEYARKVTAKEEERKDVFDLRAISNEVCQGFGKLFGYGFKGLPFFQQDLLRMLCSVHLQVQLTAPLHSKLERPFNMEKGVFVAGAPQIGKTSVFVYLKQTAYFRYRLVTSEHLRKQAEKYGGVVADEYAKGETLVIDEVGWERPANHYGNTVDIVAEILHARHAKGLRTHMTSNMSIADLAERYDPHIVARIQNTCNVLYAVGAEPIAH